MLTIDLNYPRTFKTCFLCEIGFWTTRKHQHFCSHKCQREAERKRNPNQSRYVEAGISTGTVGAIGELRVAADLMERGYDVFRAMSPASHCDLLISKNGKDTKIEVRTGYLGKSGKISWSKKATDCSQYAVVLPDRISYEPMLMDYYDIKKPC